MSPGRPSLGSWVVYGLGTENQNLPAYVVLDDPLGMPINGSENWQSGFLPPTFQGTRFRSTGSPVLNLRPDVEPPPEIVQLERDLLNRLDQIHKGRRPGHPNLDARIASYELAARMQLAAGDALDLGNESAATLRDVRHRPRADRLVRQALPDRPPPGRARGPVRAALHQRADLGQPHVALHRR